MNQQDPPPERSGGADAAGLGAFLRAARERLRPADFGVAPGRRRRTPGLRREEVAALCGVSPTWYTWIEQGRDVAASAPTLRALAEGLRLSAAERAHLFALAGRADPDPALASAADIEALRLLVDAVAGAAYVLDRHWNVVAWNAAAATLFAPWLGAPGAAAPAPPDAPPNLLRYVFLDPAAPQRIVDWQARAERLVAEFRADSAALHHDSAHRALVAELGGRSPVFASAWRAHRVTAREGGDRLFRLADGTLRHCEQFTLQWSPRPDFKLIVLAGRAGWAAPDAAHAAPGRAGKAGSQELQANLAIT